MYDGLTIEKECNKNCMFGEIGNLIKTGKILVCAANCPLMVSEEHEKIFNISDLYNVNCPRARYASNCMDVFFE